jgi:hypothetical protein
MKSKIRAPKILAEGIGMIEIDPARAREGDVGLFARKKGASVRGFFGGR